MLRILHLSGIGAAARLRPDGAVELWLGDDDCGIRASAIFSLHELDRATRWLAANSAHLFPYTPFARESRLIWGWVAGVARSS